MWRWRTKTTWTTIRRCYSGFHHSRWITLCMAFPYPVADSLDPMDHILSFDVSLIIPKNYIKDDIHGFFLDNRVHTRVWPLYPRTSGCVHSPNIFGVFLDMDPTHLTPGIPYALRSLVFDPSLFLVKLYMEPLGTLKANREIEATKL